MYQITCLPGKGGSGDGNRILNCQFTVGYQLQKEGRKHTWMDEKCLQIKLKFFHMKNDTLRTAQGEACETCNADGGFSS